MGEGHHPLSMSSRTPILGLSEMPPLNKAEFNLFKTRRIGPPSAFEEKSAAGVVAYRDASLYRQAAPQPQVNPSPQLFTSPWLNEVARISPLRSIDHSYPTSNTQVADYYPHFTSIAPRTPFYSSNVFPQSHCQQYLRDFPHLVPRAHTNVTPSLVRPIAPLISGSPLDSQRNLPSRSLLGQREKPDSIFSYSQRSSSRPEYASDGRESPPIKRRAISRASPTPGPSGVSPIPGPSRISPIPGPSGISTASHRVSPTAGPSRVSPSLGPSRVRSSPVLNQGVNRSPNTLGSKTNDALPSERGSTDRPPSPFLSHFQKGSLVNLVQGVRKVEELQTSDFVEAASAADDVSLDPSTVVSITAVEEKHTCVIAFSFLSREKEISVEVSADHPFFVFHRGWSSCAPDSTFKKYNLPVSKLQVGDVCVSLKKSQEGSETDVITDMPPPKTTPKPATRQASPSNFKIGATSTFVAGRPHSTSPNFASVPSLAGATEDTPTDLTVEKEENKEKLEMEERISIPDEKRNNNDQQLDDKPRWKRKRRWSDPYR